MTRSALMLAALVLALLTPPALAQEPQDIIPRTMQDRVLHHGKLAGVATACGVEWRELQGALIGVSIRIGYEKQQLAFIEALFDEVRQRTARNITREDCATLKPNALRNEVVSATNWLMTAPIQ